jgi:hypothetical protein
MADEPTITGPNGTSIYSDGRYTIVRFRDTDVVKIAYTDIRLDSGGSRSFITQSRMNQTSRLFDLNFHVISKRGVWLVETPKGVYQFQDGMRLLRSTGKDQEYVLYHSDNAK